MRQIGVPLAQIKAILGLAPDVAAKQVSAYWAAVEAEHAARRELAGYLVDRLTGKRPVMYEVATRQIAGRSLLCLCVTWRATTGCGRSGKRSSASLGNGQRRAPATADRTAISRSR